MASDKRDFHYLTAVTEPLATRPSVLTHEARQRFEEAIREGRSPATWRTYRSAWRGFVEFCARHGHQALPAAPDVVADYITARAEEVTVPTIEVAVAAVGAAHEVAGAEAPIKHPLVSGALKGVRRRQRMRKPRKVRAIKLEMLAKMLAAMPGNDLAVVRNRALLATAWWGSLRRSEAVALEWGDLRFEVNGVELSIRVSKSDQVGEGVVLAPPRTQPEESCPATALARWRDASGSRSGPVFVQVDRWEEIRAQRLTPQSVALIFKLEIALGGNVAERIFLDRTPPLHQGSRDFRMACGSLESVILELGSPTAPSVESSWTISLSHSKTRRLLLRVRRGLTELFEQPPLETTIRDVAQRLAKETSLDRRALRDLQLRHAGIAEAWGGWVETRTALLIASACRLVETEDGAAS